jgi:hypothetical protein
MLSSAAIAWGVSEACSTMSRQNQIQPHEQHAECDPGDRYVKQSVHDRGPPRWPSTDLQIYARVYLYGAPFPRTSDNISRVRNLVGILRTQCRQRVVLSRKDRVRSAALTSCVRQIACALPLPRFRPNAAVAPTAIAFTSSSRQVRIDEAAKLTV